MKYLPLLLFSLLAVTFSGVQIILSLTCDWWTNMLYAGVVVFSAIALRPILKLIITLAVFPYSSILITRNHQQDINR